MPSRPAMISVDWGTSSLRAYLVGADGAIHARVHSAAGILAVAGGAFEATLEGVLAPWTAAHGTLPVVMSGMIGSRQGWVEAPYLRCPAGAAGIAARLTRVPAASGRSIALVPGLDTLDDTDVPDVMRGEETQILGALAMTGRRDGRFVLPGTHSKWAHVEAGAITSFRTYMTGEVYAALKGHTILGRTMSAAAGTGEGFAMGLAAARAGRSAASLLARLFSVRTLGLFDRLSAGDAADYLSGLLIGEEVLDAAGGAASPLTVIANDELTRRYVNAGKVLGLAFDPAPPDCVVAGQVAIARIAGLVA